MARKERDFEEGVIQIIKIGLILFVIYIVLKALKVLP